MSSLKDSNPVTDPTDFRDTSVPALEEFDSLLRCHICKEFMTAPMLTSCGHSFCSICIRSYLMNTPQCPMCAKELRESNLSRNILVEEITISYKALRANLVESLSQEKAENQDKNTHQTRSADHPTVQSQEPEVIEIDERETEQKPPSKHNSDVDGDDDDVVILAEKETKKRFFDPTATGLDAFIKKPKTEKQVGERLGECPICLKKFPISVLQSTHIDDCLSTDTLQKERESSTEVPPKQTASPPDIIKSPKELTQTNSPLNKLHFSRQQMPTVAGSPFFQRSKSPSSNGTVQKPIASSRIPSKSTPELKKLTKLDFSSISTSLLKSKMSKLELPTTGTRSQLESRYNQYLILWNANCDSLQPKDKRILRKQLAQREGVISIGSGGGESETDVNWKELIKNARKTLKKSHEKSPSETEKQDDSEKSNENDAPNEPTKNEEADPSNSGDEGTQLYDTTIIEEA